MCSPSCATTVTNIIPTPKLEGTQSSDTTRGGELAVPAVLLLLTGVAGSQGLDAEMWMARRVPFVDFQTLEWGVVQSEALASGDGGSLDEERIDIFSLSSVDLYCIKSQRRVENGRELWVAGTESVDEIRTMQ